MLDCVKETNQYFINEWKQWIQEWKDVEWNKVFIPFCQNVLPVIVFFATFMATAFLTIYTFAEFLKDAPNYAAVISMTVVLVSTLVAFYSAVLCNTCAKKL